MVAAIVISLGWLAIVLFVLGWLVFNGKRQQKEEQLRERIWIKTGMTLEEYQASGDHKENYRW